MSVQLSNESAMMYPGIGLAETAELVRADVKAARADGTLALADGFTIRVRAEDDSISTSIDFYVADPPDTWKRGILSPELSAFEDALRTALTGIACRYYTPDGQRRHVTVSFNYNRYR